MLDSSSELITETANSEFVRLPFSFAKKHSVVIANDRSGELCILYKDALSQSAFSELNRVTQGAYRFEDV